MQDKLELTFRSQEDTLLPSQQMCCSKRKQNLNATEKETWSQQLGIYGKPDCSNFLMLGSLVSFESAVI